MPRRRQVQQKKSKSNKIIIIGIIAAVVIVGGLVAVNAFAPNSTPPVASNSRDWGSPNAPVTVVEYSDFQ